MIALIFVLAVYNRYADIPKPETIPYSHTSPRQRSFNDFSINERPIYIVALLADGEECKLPFSVFHSGSPVTSEILAYLKMSALYSTRLFFI